MKIFPVYYFPPVSWFAAAVNGGQIILEQHEYYRKQHCFNRTNILTPNGVLKLSIPIRKSPEYTPLYHRTISYDWTWRKIHWRSLISAYRSSPYFEYYEDRLAPFFTRQTESLMKLNLDLLTVVRDALKVDLEWTLSDGYHDRAHYTEDFRNGFDAKLQTTPSWFRPAPYPQVFGTKFVPDLSILDLLFNCGPESVRILRDSIVEPSLEQ
ncbi:MAG: WbqC family protein [Bacteroidota bacterium]